MAPNRRRLGVALVLDPPVAAEVGGLRRAVGDPSLVRIPPHITLVPPVNVRRADLGEALARLRQAAGSVPGALRLTLGAPSTFMPVNPVLYLAVGGDIVHLRTLRDAVFQPPLARTLSWPWVPHVTLADGAPPERIAAALEAMGDYQHVADIDRVVLLEEGPGRVWTALFDAELGPAARVGTGGLTVELSTGRLIDPELRAHPDWPEYQPRPGLMPDLAVTAYREGRPVGAALARVDAAGPRLDVHVLEAHRGQGIGSHLLAHAEHGLRRRGWEWAQLGSAGPAPFYRARSRWVSPDRLLKGDRGV